MSNEENKRIIAERLERRKAERVAAEQEAKLERYEQDQIRACNENCVGARRSGTQSSRPSRASRSGQPAGRQ